MPLETAGSALGPPSYVRIVASQVPSSAARILCSGSGFWTGGDSWAVPVLARDHAARHVRARVRLGIETPRAGIGRDMGWAPCRWRVRLLSDRLNRYRAGF